MSRYSKVVLSPKRNTPDTVEERMITSPQNKRGGEEIYSINAARIQASCWCPQTLCSLFLPLTFFAFEYLNSSWYTELHDTPDNKREEIRIKKCVMRRRRTGGWLTLLVIQVFRDEMTWTPPNHPSNTPPMIFLNPQPINFHQMTPTLSRMSPSLLIRSLIHLSIHLSIHYSWD